MSTYQSQNKFSVSWQLYYSSLIDSKAFNSLKFKGLKHNLPLLCMVVKSKTYKLSANRVLGKVCGHKRDEAGRQAI
jgi:hypothetical protein